MLDTPSRELRNPVTSATGTVAAYRSLRRAASLLGDWASMLGDRELVLASPRASCAGVQRAVEVVERALEQYGAPVYVRRQIVHNGHVVDSLRRRGAVFVDEVEQVPPGATVVFSAHGVSPEVRRHAAARQLNVIDATCPLVAKVHAEARRFAADGFDIVLVGHGGHEEVEGTVGEAPEQTTVITSTEDVARLRVSDPEHVAYLTQTTLAVDETTSVVGALRERFPAGSGRRLRTSATRPRTARPRSALSPNAAICCSSSVRRTRRTRDGWSRSRTGPVAAACWSRTRPSWASTHCEEHGGSASAPAPRRRRSSSRSWSPPWAAGRRYRNGIKRG